MTEPGSGDAEGMPVAHVEVVDFVGREEHDVWSNDGWSLLRTPGHSGISNAVQDALNRFAEASKNSAAAAERRARSPLRVRQVDWWGQAMWTGPSALALSRQGRVQFALTGLSIRPDWRHGLWMQFLVTSPRFVVPLAWERRQDHRAESGARRPAAGDLGVEMLARTRILDACCLARRDTPEVAVEAVRLLHQVAFAANSGDLPAAKDTTAAARRLFEAGYEEFTLRSHTWADMENAADRHGRGRRPGAASGPVAPAAILDLAADTLSGLTQAYRDLGQPDRAG